MPVIDAHVHLYPAEVNRDPEGWARGHGELEWAAMCTRRRKSGRPVQGFPSVDELLHAMDTAGVERAVLLGWYWHREATCSLQNRFFSECVRAHPDRFSAFATVQPKAGRAAVQAELSRAHADGLIGLGELSPHSQCHGLDEPGFHAALEWCAQRHWPVNLHVTDPNMRDYPGRVMTPPEDFLRLAREWPDVNFILAHWGGLLPLRDPDAVGMANLFYDTAASPLIYDDSVWARFLHTVPAERVLFGSDFPLDLFPRDPHGHGLKRFLAEARGSGVPEAVLGVNAAKLLRL